MTTEEKTMLHPVAEEYEVDPAYVLDMYRHGKVNWMLDFAIRAGVGILLLVVGSVIVRGVKSLSGATRKTKWVNVENITLHSTGMLDIWVTPKKIAERNGRIL